MRRAGGAGGKRLLASPSTQGAEDLYEITGIELHIEPAHPFAIRKNAHVFANPALFIDDPEPDARVLVVEARQCAVDVVTFNDHSGNPVCVIAELLRNVNTNAHDRSTTSTE